MRHNRWVWFNALMIALSCVVAYVFGADWGVFLLAALLFVGGAARLTLPSRVTAGLTTRSRYLDTTFFWAAAAAVTFLAATAPRI